MQAHLLLSVNWETGKTEGTCNYFMPDVFYNKKGKNINIDTIMKLSVIKIFTSFLIVLCGFTSCKQDELEAVADTAAAEESEIPVEEYTGEVLDVNYAISIPQYANVLNAEESASSRSLKEDAQGKIHFDYTKMSDVVIHLCMQNGDDVNSRSFKTVSAKIVPNGTGFQVQVPDPYVQLKKGELEGDSWKVCAIMESTERTKDQRIFDQNKYVSTINTNTYFSVNKNVVKGNLSSLTTPLYSQYVAVRKKNGKIYLDLNFKPLGTIIKMKVVNSLAIPIYIDKVKIKNPNIKAGLAQVTLGEESNGIVKFAFSSTGEKALWNPDEVCTWNISPAKVGLEPEFLYLWCIPVSSNPVQSQIEFIYETTLASDNMKKDSVMLNPSTKSVGMQSGFFYNVTAALPESDLMITELLHNDPGGWNYTVVEIYNPTNKTIDIRNYGLCRIINWDSDNSFYLVGEWNKYPKSDFTQALVQDLYIERSDQPVYRGDGQLANGAYQKKNRFYDMYGTHLKKGPDCYMLKPGNTVVVAAGGLRYRLAERKNKDQWYWPTGSLMYNSPYLANAVKTGHCQYAVAVDNGASENQYSNWRYMDVAGAMQHGSTQILVLVKKEGAGQKYNTVDWLYSIYTYSTHKVLIDKALPSYSGTIGNDWIFVSRKESVMYPVSKRDNSIYLHPSKMNLPPFEVFLDDSRTYQFYDWVYRFGREPREYQDEMKAYMTPGTRIYDSTVDNNRNWMAGAYNETGDSTSPNPTTGK